MFLCNWCEWKAAGHQCHEFNFELKLQPILVSLANLGCASSSPIEVFRHRKQQYYMITFATGKPYEASGLAEPVLLA